MNLRRPMPTFYEFFAGGGMARAALTRSGWRCLFANDFDAKKVESYVENWGDQEIRHGDVGKLTSSDLPEHADLVWASFPCQDLSLAGGGAGLLGNRSGTFWPFWKLIKQLGAEDRAPTTVVLENVCGTLTSHGGKDFRAICSALVSEGYLVGALVMDAAHFVPQSRPRLFVVGTRQSPENLSAYIESQPRLPWHTKALMTAYDGLSSDIQQRWVWWNLPAPAKRKLNFSDIVERSSNELKWHSGDETQRLLDMMSPVNRKKIANARASKKLCVGTVYRRTRVEAGVKVQRAEIRFDEVAGCLRTPAGGSSRQILLFVERGETRSRLISARETARLMGLPEQYELPKRYNDAYHLTGDGVAVPVVEYLSRNLLHQTLDPETEKKVA